MEKIKDKVKEKMPTPWKYTDDVLAIGVTGAWIAGKILGYDIPDEMVILSLGYAFGKNLQ